MLQSIRLECRGREGTWGFPKRNRKWTCGEASGAMERKRFLLECQRGTVWVVLQPEKPLRESLQQALSLQSYCEKWRHLFLTSCQGTNTPCCSLPLQHVQFEEKVLIFQPVGSVPPWGSRSLGAGKSEQKSKEKVYWPVISDGSEGGE